jgi:hypothetical protein
VTTERLPLINPISPVCPIKLVAPCAWRRRIPFEIAWGLSYCLTANREPDRPTPKLPTG